MIRSFDISKLEKHFPEAYNYLTVEMRDSCIAFYLDENEDLCASTINGKIYIFDSTPPWDGWIENNP